MGLSLPKSNLIFLKKCLDKWVHFTLYMENYQLSAANCNKRYNEAQPFQSLPSSSKHLFYNRVNLFPDNLVQSRLFPSNASCMCPVPNQRIFQQSLLIQGDMRAD